MGSTCAVQFQGSSSSRRCIGWAAMRERISASQACGSTPFIFAVTMRLYMAAARCPPRSDPQNSHDFLPSAIPRSPRSAALLDRHTRPSSRNSVNAVQRVPIRPGPQSGRLRSIFAANRFGECFSGGLSGDGHDLRLPVPGQQFIKAVHRMGGDA